MRISLGRDGDLLLLLGLGIGSVLIGVIDMVLRRVMRVVHRDWWRLGRQHEGDLRGLRICILGVAWGVCA